jgi:hypothetical protein
METDLDLNVQYHLLVGDARSRKRKDWRTCEQGVGGTEPWLLVELLGYTEYYVGMYSFALQDEVAVPSNPWRCPSTWRH